MITKTNIIRSEARRILQNCKSRDSANKHLETLMDNLVSKSGYPREVAAKHILIGINQFETTPSEAKPKKEYDFVLKVPYVSELFTRKVTESVRRSGINARIVSVPGRSVRSLISAKTQPECSCVFCGKGLSCGTSHFVYEAECKTCRGKYNGASARPLPYRINEHESSCRLQNDATTLGQHIKHHIRNSDISINDEYELLKGKRNHEFLFNNFDIQIVRKCYDSLDTFINEGLVIKNDKPSLNNMNNNGFVE